MADNKKIAQDVLDAVGGKGNVTFATHCMTRLRLNLKDASIVDDSKVKAIDGVLGIQRVGEQYQVIIGQNVAKVYPEFIALAGVEQQDAIDENLDGKAAKEPMSLKKVGTAILDYLSGSMVPILPAIMVSGLVKAISVILGPTVLGIVPDDSSLATLFNIIYNAGMYFLPFYLAYSAANKLGTKPILAAILAGILLEPSFVALAGTEGASLDFFGLPIRLTTYSQSVVPILLSVWVMSYVERFFTKVIPDVLSTVFVPLCTILVMAPLSLVALAPLGTYLGDGIAALLMALYNAGGLVTIIAMVALMVLQPFLVITGMHMAILTFGLTAFAVNGSEPYVIVCNLLSNFAIWGAVLATAIRFKRPEDRGNSVTSFVSGIIGGVNEPSLFGIPIPHQRVFACVCAANAVVGVLAALLRVQFMNLGTSSILCLFCFVSAEGPQNVLNAAICGGVGFAVAFVLSFLFGLSKKEREGIEEA